MIGDIGAVSMLALLVSIVALVNNFIVECIIKIENDQLATIIKQFGGLVTIEIIVSQELVLQDSRKNFSIQRE